MLSYFPDDPDHLKISDSPAEHARHRERFWQRWLSHQASILSARDNDRIKPPSVITIVGVPMDIGVGYRSGTRFGPRAIREASKQFGSGVEAGLDISRMAKKIVDLGDVDIHPYVLSGNLFRDEVLTSIRQHEIDEGAIATIGFGNLDNVQKLLEWILGVQPEIDRVNGDKSEYVVLPSGPDPASWKGNAFPVVLGGDHSITTACVRAVRSAYPREQLGVIYFDAHPDYLPSRSGLRDTHASQARRVGEIVGPKNIFQAGIRYLEPDELAGLKKDKVTFWPMEAISNERADVFAHRILNAVRHRGITHLYLSIDIDVLDAGLVPGTGVPEPGGMSTRQLIDILRYLGQMMQHDKELKLVGMDLVEVAPDLDIGGITALAAAKILFEALGAYFISEEKR